MEDDKLDFLNNDEIPPIPVLRRSKRLVLHPVVFLFDDETTDDETSDTDFNFEDEDDEEGGDDIK